MAADTSTTPPTSDSPPARASKRRTLIELSVGYALVLLVLWTPRHAQRPFYIAAILWIAVVTCISFDGIRAMGLRLPVPLRARWIVPAALILAAIAFAAAAALHTLHLPPTAALFVKRYWGYAIWAAIQQFLLQDFFLLRLLRLLRTSSAAVIAAVILFTVAHLPNPILTPLTLLWGLASCLLFLRYRSLYPLAVAHAILGITLAITVPGPVDHNMRVGRGYLIYQHHLSQNPHTVSTSVCVIAEAPTLRSSRHALP